MMDSGTASVLVVIVLALVIIAVIVTYRRSRIKMTGPLKVSLEIDGSNKPESQPAIKASDITSRSGGLLADDQTGHGLEVSRAEVEGEVLLSSRNPDHDPKGRPPAKSPGE